MNRLLYSQHLGGIWTGQTPYRLTYDTLSGYPETWSWKISGRGMINLVLWKKKRTQTWGETLWKNQSPRISLTLFLSRAWKKQSPRNCWVFFLTPFPTYVWDSIFFFFSSLILTNPLDQDWPKLNLVLPNRFGFAWFGFVRPWSWWSWSWFAFFLLVT